MQATKYLIDTNILIYHIAGAENSVDFISKLINQQTFNISVLTKIEFLGWDKHTPDGFEKCRQLIKSANVYHVDNEIAEKTIEIKKSSRIKLADAVIAATALVHNLKLATRNIEDFKTVPNLDIINPFLQ